MNHSVRADLNHFIKNLLQALKPIAKAEDIDLSFSPSAKPVTAIFQAPVLAGDVTHIICKMLEFTPEQEKIKVSIETTNTQKCRLIIRNTGINLIRNGEVTSSCKLKVVVESAFDGTQYGIEVDLYEDLSKLSEEVFHYINGPNYIPDYYAEIRRRLRSHFTKSDNLVEALSRSNPREATFLKKVNEMIVNHMENHQFDTNRLSEIMNMSRTQLFRRLKPIIQQSPGSYIRMIKLQKAKELFETTDLRISEVAHKTGFETASHFTKVFTKQYGVKPSLFCKKKDNATNE